MSRTSGSKRTSRSVPQAVVDQLENVCANLKDMEQQLRSTKHGIMTRGASVREIRQANQSIGAYNSALADFQETRERIPSSLASPHSDSAESPSRSSRSPSRSALFESSLGSSRPGRAAQSSSRRSLYGESSQEMEPTRDRPSRSSRHEVGRETEWSREMEPARERESPSRSFGKDWYESSSALPVRASASYSERGARASGARESGTRASGARDEGESSIYY